MPHRPKAPHEPEETKHNPQTPPMPRVGIGKIVKSLAQAADKTGGIGKQVRELAHGRERLPAAAQSKPMSPTDLTAGKSVSRRGHKVRIPERGIMKPHGKLFGAAKGAVVQEAPASEKALDNRRAVESGYDALRKALKD